MIEQGMISSNSEIRAVARERLTGNWGKSILFCFLLVAISSVVSYIPKIGSIIGFLISGAMALGSVTYFIKLIRDEPNGIEDLFAGFKNYVAALVLSLFTAIFVFLWTLLLVVPGIIAAFRYSMAYYILHDNPGIGIMEAINQSGELMKGYKWKLFLLYFSFIGWFLLCILTLGIGFLWLSPYVEASKAAFYEDLHAARQAVEVPVDPGTFTV